MATTGELQAIIEELQLIDAGDAVSYLGEEASGENSSATSGPLEDASHAQMASPYDYAVSSF